MRLNFGLLRTCCLTVFLIISLPVAYGSSNERIKGVSEFLTDRFQENYFYMFELRLQENQLFRQYFPETYKYAASGDLRFLLRADNGIWKNSIEADIKNLLSKYMVQFFQSQFLVKLSSDKWVSDYTKMLAELELVVNVADNGRQVKVLDIISNKIPYAGHDPKILELKTLYSSYGSAVEKILDKTILQKNIETIMVRLSAVQKQVDKLQEFINGFKIYMQNYNGTELLINENRLYKLDDFAEQLGSLNEQLKKVEGIKNELEVLVDETFNKKSFFRIIASQFTAFEKLLADKKINYVSYIWRLEQIIRESRELVGLETNTKEYRRFRQYLFFFAQLSNPNSSEQVKSLLKEVTLPAVSFGIKRDRHEHQLLITSYIGYGGGVELGESGEKDKSFYGLLAPVGIEYNYGLSSKGSFSIMYAPFDFAYPINLELNDDEREVSLTDIIVHGVYVTYGFNNYPIAVGLGFSKGKSVRHDDRDEKKVFVFFAMDMPLLELY